MARLGRYAGLFVFAASGLYVILSGCSLLT